MGTQKSSPFRQLASFSFALAVLGVILNGAVGMGAADQVLSDQKHKKSYDVIITQNAAKTSTGQEAASLPEGQKSDSKTEEEKEAARPTKKALKDFRPTEQIEAEQAVDFPYDI